MTVASIYAGLPGYTKACEDLDRIKKTPRPATTGAVSTVDQTVRDVLDGLDGDQPAEEVLLSSARRAVVEVEAVRIARIALEEAAARLTARRDDIVRQHSETILTGLDDLLADVVRQTRALLPLEPIGTELAAYQADRYDDHRALQRLRNDYTNIRREQHRIVTDHMGDVEGDDGLLRIALYLRDPAAVFPLWRPWQSHGYVVSERQSRIRPVLPPWPVPADNGLRPDRGEGTRSKETLHRDAGSGDFLTWAVTTDAEVWVPTMTQFAAKAAELSDQLLDPDRPLDLGDGWLDPGAMNRGTLNPSRPAVLSASRLLDGAVI